MFDEEYESDQDEDVRMGYKNVTKVNPKTLTPSESNMTLSMKQGDELMKLMKQRGIQIKESEISKLKTKQPQPAKKSSKAGFYDGGHSAPLEVLFAALKKAYTNNDPQQASCILSYILQNSGLSVEDRSKFGLMKCNLLFNLAAYEECCERATELIDKPLNEVAYAQLSNYLAKSKAQLGRVWQGYMDLQRAKSLMTTFEGQKRKEAEEDLKQGQQYFDSELDSIIRDVNHTELEYNIRVSKEVINKLKQKSTLNLIHPIFNVFRNRRVTHVSAGEYHVLFLVGSVEYDKELNGRWSTEVFGLGQNRAGQVSGSIEYKTSFSEPILVKELSGKGIEGVYAFKESSLAYDQCGNVFQWGAKSNGHRNVELSCSIGEKIKKIQRGNNHYCALTNQSRLFVWGKLQFLQTAFYNQPKPSEAKIQSVRDFSCGSNYILVVDSKGDLWGIGSNQYGQLASPGNKYFKQFTKINTNKIGQLSKVYCLFECSFMQTTQQELFFCGRHSYNKEPLQSPKQAEFPDEPKIISVSGQPGLYYATNQYGNTYVWEVDNSVKFKLEKQKEKLTQRFVECSKGNVYRIKTLPVPKLCTGAVVSKQLKTYEPILVEVSLRDEHGQYGLDLCQPVKYTVHLSRKILKKDEIIEQSEKFLKLTANKYKQNKPFLDEIMGSDLVVSKIRQNQEKTEYDKHILEFSVEKSGTYYLYLLMDSVLINGKPFELVVETSEKEAELERKMQQQKQRRRLEREAQRLKEDEDKRQQDEEQELEIERRKETQKRAEETYKQHMRQQQEQRRKQQQDRKRRAQLSVGGGFDLNKLKKKQSQEVNLVQSTGFEAAKIRKKPSQEHQDPNTTADNAQSRRKLDYQNYSGEVPQLPDINARPSSKRKLILKKSDIAMSELLSAKTSTSTASKVNEFKTAVSLKRGDSKSKK